MFYLDHLVGSVGFDLTGHNFVIILFLSYKTAQKYHVVFSVKILKLVFLVALLKTTFQVIIVKCFFW